MKKEIEYFFGDRGFFSEFNNMCYFYDWAQRNGYTYVVNSRFWFNDQKINLNHYFEINDFTCKTNLSVDDFFYYYMKRASRKIFKIFRLRYTEKVNLNRKKNRAGSLSHKLFDKKAGSTIDYFGKRNFDYIRRECFNYMRKISIEKYIEYIAPIFSHLWNFNAPTAKEIKLRTPDILKNGAYITIHIRRGDKLIEEDRLYQIDEYFDVINGQYPETKTIFVMTDDKAVVSEIKKRYPDFTCASLIRSDQKGHDSKKHYTLSYDKRADSLLQLWTEVEIAKMSTAFLGSAGSNVYRSICYLRNDIACHDLSGKMGDDL